MSKHGEKAAIVHVCKSLPGQAALMLGSDLNDRVKRERESLHFQFIPQMAVTARAGQAEARSWQHFQVSSDSPGNQADGPSCDALPGVLAGSWSIAAGSGSGVQWDTRVSGSDFTLLPYCYVLLCVIF